MSFLAVMSLLLIPGVLQSVNAATILVDSTLQSSNPSTNGCTLGRAIVAANEDKVWGSCTAGSGSDTILLPARFYTLTAADNSYGGLGDNGLPPITSDITIISVLGTNADNIAVIERDVGKPGFRIFYVDFGGTLRLTGVTLRNGQVSGPGGAILNQGEVIISNSTLANNETVDEGGAIKNKANGIVDISESTLIGNIADTGAGISNDGTAVIYDTGINNNDAVGAGGGIFNNRGTVTLNNKMLLSGNYAGTDGGGIFNDHGIIAIKNRSVITKNASGRYGGGVFNDGGTMTINETTINKNDAGQHGGGILNDVDGALTLYKTTLSLNRAGLAGNGDGGGIFNGNVLFNEEGNVTVAISNSSIADNSADNGGGVFNASELSLINTTLGGNTARSDGGGIYSNSRVSVAISSSTLAKNTAASGGGIFVNPEPGTAPLHLKNTILANNYAPSGPDCKGVLQSLDYNLIEDKTDCGIPLASHDINKPANLGPFVNSGAAGNGHFSLLINSTAIERGNGVACTEKDQIGQARIERCDIGAIEYPEMLPPLDVLDLTKVVMVIYGEPSKADYFSIVGLLSKSPLEEFEQPFAEDVTVNVRGIIGQEPPIDLYQIVIAADTLDGFFRDRNGEPTKKKDTYSFTGPAPVRKVNLSRPAAVQVRMDIFVERTEILLDQKEQQSPSMFLEYVSGISAIEVDMLFSGGRAWHGTVPLVLGNYDTRKVVLVMDR